LKNRIQGKSAGIKKSMVMKRAFMSITLLVLSLSLVMMLLTGVVAG